MSRIYPLTAWVDVRDVVPSEETLVVHLANHGTAAPDDVPAGSHGHPAAVVTSEHQPSLLIKMSGKPVEEARAEETIQTVARTEDDPGSPTEPTSSVLALDAPDVSLGKCHLALAVSQARLK